MFVTFNGGRLVEGMVSCDLRNTDEQFSVVLVHEGAIGSCGGIKFLIPAHSVVCIHPEERIKIDSADGAGIDVLYFSPKFANINYTFAELQRIHEKVEKAEYEGEFCFKTGMFFDRRKYPLGIVALRTSQYRSVDRLFDVIRTNFNDPPDGYWSCRARSALGMILTIASGITNEFSDDPAMGRVINYIQDNYSKKITDETLSSVSGLGVAEINRRMTDKYGVTCAKYINSVRVDAACLSLAYTELPVVEISAACGFGDQQYFSRVFRDHKGRSPLQYRKYAQESRKAFYLDRKPVK